MRQKVPSPAVQSTVEEEDDYDDDTDEDEDEDDDDDEEEDEQSHFSEGQLVPASSRSDDSEISEDIVEGKRGLRCLYILLPYDVTSFQTRVHVPLVKSPPTHAPGPITSRSQLSGRCILFEASDKKKFTRTLANIFLMRTT